jgi:hypothetical protein
MIVVVKLFIAKEYRALCACEEKILRKEKEQVFDEN